VVFGTAKVQHAVDTIPGNLTQRDLRTMHKTRKPHKKRIQGNFAMKVAALCVFASTPALLPVVASQEMRGSSSMRDICMIKHRYF